MSDNQMSDLLRASVDGIREVAGADCFIGTPIETNSGVTVIPVSRIFVAFASGGLDLTEKKVMKPQGFGGGGGTGITVMPTAFLTVTKEGVVGLVPIETKNQKSNLSKISDIIDNFPNVLSKVKDVLTK